MFEKLRGAVRRLLGLAPKRERFTVRSKPVHSCKARDVKRLLPRSAFTKKGPGVRRSLLLALRDMTPRQRAVAKAHGWDKGLLH